jgi:hypothetical protein
MRAALCVSIVAASFVAGVSTALSGEVSITQIDPRHKPLGCDLCDYKIGPASAPAPDISVRPGPPGTHDIVQLGDNNVALGLVIGPGNYLGQFQLGDYNRSLVGLIAKEASVTVVQDGSNLQSKLLVWGDPGAPVAVYQPQGSPPLNAAILTAADGTQVVLPGNATTIIRR